MVMLLVLIYLRELRHFQIESRNKRPVSQKKIISIAGEIIKQLEDSQAVMVFAYGGDIAKRVKAACQKCPHVKV